MFVCLITSRRQYMASKKKIKQTIKNSNKKKTNERKKKIVDLIFGCTLKQPSF